MTTTAERLAAHGIPDYMVRGYVQAEAMYAGMNVVSPSIGRGLTADLLDIIERLASDPPAPEVPEALRHLGYTPTLSPHDDAGPCWLAYRKMGRGVPSGCRWRYGSGQAWHTSAMPSEVWVEAQPIPAPATVTLPPIDRRLTEYLASADFETTQLQALTAAARAALAEDGEA